MEVLLLPLMLFYIAAALMFTPFVHRVSKAPLLKSVWFSFVLQAITSVVYVFLFFVTSGVLLLATHKPVALTSTFIPTFISSLFVVFPIASLSARKLLGIADPEQLNVVRAGNILVAAALWILLWIAPF